MKKIHGMMICCVVLVTLIPAVSLAQFHEGNKNVNVTPTTLAPGDMIDVSFKYTIWLGPFPEDCPWEILLDEGPINYDDRGGILLASGSCYHGGFLQILSVNATGLVIPADTESGQYTIKIATSVDASWSTVAYSHVPITVEAGDSTAPVIVLNDPSSDELWPPDNKSVDVIFTGNVTDEGSGVALVQLVLEDEYGTLSDIIDITGQLDGNGDFEVTLGLIASRNGIDRDGRQYDISIRATDVAGNEANSESVTVLVPHDQKNKKARVRNNNRNCVAATEKKLSRVRQNRRGGRVD